MKYIFTFFAIVFSNYIMGQQVGSKVTFPATDGKTYTGVITQIQGDKYNVKYDGFDFSSWLTAKQFTITDNNSQPATDQPALPQNTQQTITSTTPETIPSTIPSTIPQNNSQSVTTDNSGQKTMTHSDSLRQSLNNMKTAVSAFSKLFTVKRDTMTIVVADIDYDNLNLAQLKDNLKNVHGVKSVIMHYKSGSAVMEISYKGKVNDVWDNLPSTVKSPFKLMEIGDNNILLKPKSIQ